MGKFLSDGAVMPSFDAPQSFAQAGLSAYSQVMANSYLRLGFVIAATQIGQRTSYDVVCVQVDGQGAETTNVYRNCRPLTAFGSVADYEYHKLRVAPKYTGGITQDVYENSSQVLILCLNGRSDSAYILGETNVPLKDQNPIGQALAKEFNGVNYAITDDGGVRITVKGPTNSKGELREGEGATTKGTYAEIDSTGSVNVIVDSNNSGGFVNIKSAGTRIGAATDKMILGDTYRAAEDDMLSKISEQLKIAMQALMAAGSAMTTPLTGPVIAAPSITAAANAIGQAATAIDTFKANADSYMSKKNLND